MEVIETMIKYLKHSNSESLSFLEEIKEEITHSSLYALFSQIIRWIKASFLYEEGKPLLIDNVNILEKLNKLIELYPEFSEVFILNGNELDFSPTLTEKEITNIRQYARENHKTVKRTSYKRSHIRKQIEEKKAIQNKKENK